MPLGDQLVEKRALQEGPLFVAIADIELKKGKEEEFKKWFLQSNRALEGQDGLIARRLLKSPRGDGQQQQQRTATGKMPMVMIMVVMKSREAFANMHMTPEHAKLHAEALSFMTRPPRISAYDAVL
ncbi:MAG TPA: hypothetical protein VHA09_05980 [Nitrososphaera sp.]|nr:hypothetical protein [Nitrososphaera sp.]